MARPIVRLVFNRIPQMTPQIEEGAIRIVSRSAANIEAAAKSVVPVRTGTLRRSIHQEPIADAIEKTIGPSVNYAAFVEYGTRYMSARPYMTPAAEGERPRFEAAMVELLRGL